MPEEVELDIREQQEKLEELHREHEELEREEKKDNSWTRDVSMSTALLAVVAAVAALHSGTLVNEALLEQNKAVKFQAQASDKWAEYQANSIKGRGSEQTAALLSAVNPAQSAQAEKYTKDAEKVQRQKRWSVGRREETGRDAGRAGKRVGAPHAPAPYVRVLRDVYAGGNRALRHRRPDPPQAGLVRQPCRGRDRSRLHGLRLFRTLIFQQ